MMQDLLVKALDAAFTAHVSLLFSEFCIGVSTEKVAGESQARFERGMAIAIDAYEKATK